MLFLSLLLLSLRPASALAPSGLSPERSRVPDVRLGEAKLCDMSEAASLLVSSFFGSLAPSALAALASREHARLTRHHGGERHVQLWARAADGTMVGFVDLDLRPNKHEPRPYVSDLAVRPDFRRQRLATRLVRSCEQLCLYQYEVDDIYLKVETTNLVALDLYAKLGYEVHQRVEFGTKALLRKRLGLGNPSFGSLGPYHHALKAALFALPSSHVATACDLIPRVA